MKRFFVCAAVLAASMSGCAPATGTISGTVTVQGEPMKMGLICFLPEEGSTDPFNAGVRDGKYSIPDVPCGRCKAYVVESDGPPGGPPAANAPVEQMGSGGDLLPVRAGAGGGPPKRRFHERFSNPDESGLELDVKKGENKFDVNLTP